MTKLTTEQLLKLGFDRDGNRITTLQHKVVMPASRRCDLPAGRQGRDRAMAPLPTGNHADPSPFIFIPGEVPSGKNSKRAVAKGVLVSSVPTLRYKKEKAADYIEKAFAFRNMSVTLGKPFTVFMKFVRATAGQWDSHNASQIVADMMQEHGWIDNDDARNIVIHPTPHFLVDKDNPGVYIFL